MYRKRMNQFRGMASQQYGNFGGPFHNASGVSSLDPNDRTLTMSVENTDTANAATCTIFGSVYDLTDSNLNSDITITVDESSHLEVKTELLTSPFFITGLRYQVESVGQFAKSWSIYRERSTGGQEKRIVQPSSWRSAQNNITTQVDALDFRLLVDKNTYVQFELLADEKVTIYFYISEKLDTENILKNQAVVRQVNSPIPTGLPQLDMFGRKY